MKFLGLMSKAFATKQPERCEGGSGDNCSDWQPQKYGKKDRAREYMLVNFDLHPFRATIR